MSEGKDRTRIWELDFLRGIALICMVYFHVIFDMKEFYNYPVSYGTGVNYFIGKIAVVLFTFISGISCYLSRNNVKRGLKILGAGMLITAVTYVFNPDYTIIFGVLHFLGTCILLVYPAARKLSPVLLAVIGTAVIALGSVVSGINPSHNYFFFIGITNNSFRSGDYYPLVPWSGIFLYGIAAGKTLYSQKKSIFAFNPGDNIISTAGRHTLLVYLLHQPIILAVLKLIDML